MLPCRRLASAAAAAVIDDTLAASVSINQSSCSSASLPGIYEIVEKPVCMSSSTIAVSNIRLKG